MQCLGGGRRRWYLSTVGGRRGDCFNEVERGMCVMEVGGVYGRENTFGGESQFSS